MCFFFMGGKTKAVFDIVISELTQWWFNAFSLGNNAMAVQSQPDTQQKFMNKLMDYNSEWCMIKARRI